MIEGVGTGVLRLTGRGLATPAEALEEISLQLRAVGEQFSRATQASETFFQTVVEGALRATSVLTPLVRMLGGTPWLGEFQYVASVLTFFFHNLTALLQTLHDTTQTLISSFMVGFNTIGVVVHSLTATFSQFTGLVFNATARITSAFFFLGSIGAAIAGAGLGYLVGGPAGAAIGGALGWIVGRLGGQITQIVLTLLETLMGSITQILNTISNLLTLFAQQLGALFRTTVLMLTRIFTEFIQTMTGLWQMFGAVAARAETTAVALQVLARNAGISRQQILGLWEALTKQNISLIEGGNAMIMLMARFPQLGLLVGRLSEVAKDWAAAMGFVSSEVLRDFAVAVTRGEMAMLEHLNIVYPASMAWQMFAVQVGKAAQDLNALERSLAVANFLINQIGRSVRGVYEETFDTLGKLLTSFQRVYQEVQVAAGRELLGAFSAIGRTLYAILQVVKESEGLRGLFRFIGAGVLEGLRRVFGPTEFEKDPERNPVARMLRAVLESPQFRDAAQRIGGVVAGLTEMMARGLFNLLRNLPQILERILNLFRAIYVLLIGIFTIATYIWRAIVNWAAAVTGFTGQLNAVQAVIAVVVAVIQTAGEGIAKLFEFLSVAFPKVTAFIAEFVKWLITAFSILLDLGKALSTPFVWIVTGFLFLIGQWDLAMRVIQMWIKGWFFPSPEWHLKLAQWSEGFKRWGQDVSEVFGGLSQKARDFFGGMAYEVGQAMQQTAQSTQALTQAQAYQFRQVEERLGQMITLFRTWATQSEILQSATRALIGYYSELYGGLEDLGALLTVNLIQAWRQVEAAFTNMLVVMTILSDPNRFRALEPLFAEELFQEMAEALQGWARAVNEIFERLNNVAREVGRLIEVTARLTQMWVFGATETLMLLEYRRRILQVEIQLLALWSTMPLGFQRRIEVTRQLVDAYTELLRITQEELRLVSQLAHAWAQTLTSIADDIERLAERIFFAPLNAMEAMLLRLRAIMVELRAAGMIVARALFFGDVPYETYADALRRYNAAMVQAIETIVGALNRPLQQITSMLDNQIRYWRTARDMVNSFNLGMYAVLSVHISEAQVLLEKLRILELMATINRYNADLYWRIRAEIINIKRELFDIARRPIFIFGLTREQIEAAFRDFSRTIADPRFWARWRLFGAPLAEMALRTAIWAQQPGMAAIPVFDPRLIAMLGLPQILSIFPLIRWWGLVQEVTGRRHPFDIRTLIQAAGLGILREIYGVPQPLMGMPSLNYFFALMPQVFAEAARYGYLPNLFLHPYAPFQPLISGFSALIQPSLNIVSGLFGGINRWLAQIFQQAQTINFILTNMAILHRFYMPRIDAHLLNLLRAVGRTYIRSWIEMPPEAFEDPTRFVAYARRREAMMGALRHQYTGGVPLPAGVPVMMGTTQIGTLYFNEAILRQWAIQIALQVVENVLRGFVVFPPIR